MKSLKIVKAVLVLLMAVFLSPGMNAQINAEQCIIIGRNVLSMEDYMLSIQYFNQAIKAKPYLSDPYFFRGLAKLYLEDYKGAEDDCTLAIERNKYKTESYKVRGFARQYLGKDSLAVEDYKLGLAHNPEEKYFLFYKAVAETELKRNSDADSTFALLLRLYPRFEDGYAARGRLRAIEGDTVAAISDFSKAISLSPSSVNPYLQRAEIEAAQKEWDKAAADMDEAIRLKPQESDFYVNRAYLRYNNDDFFGAMSDYNYALELAPYNTSALFNRALLRYEVRDLDRSAADMNEVLRMDPDNFHARYNLGLVNLERGKYREALKDFDIITKRFPRFYAAYYAKAEAWHKLGDMRAAIQNVHTAEDLVKKYVKNPEKYKLDRPSIASGQTNTSGLTPDGEGEDDESEIEVMKRFNQLVTVSANSGVQLSFNEKIKGRVQDREMGIDPEPSYVLSFYDSPQSLSAGNGFLRELDDFNGSRYIDSRIYLSAGGSIPESQEAMDALFSKAGYYTGLMEDGNSRPADLLALGIIRWHLKDYDAALEALDKALERDPRFLLALLARAAARERRAATSYSSGDEEDSAEAQLKRRTVQRDIAGAIADYDAALALNPRLFHAWFDKGNIYYSQRDYTSAMQCYSEALRMAPDFGEAYYNRGICYLQMGNRRQAFIDLSKAGELGVVPAYSLLKKMK